MCITAGGTRTGSRTPGIFLLHKLCSHALKHKDFKYTGTHFPYPRQLLAVCTLCLLLVWTDLPIAGTVDIESERCRLCALAVYSWFACSSLYSDACCSAKVSPSWKRRNFFFGLCFEIASWVSVAVKCTWHHRNTFQHKENDGSLDWSWDTTIALLQW